MKLKTLATILVLLSLIIMSAKIYELVFILREDNVLSWWGFAVCTQVIFFLTAAYFFWNFSRKVK